MVPVFLLSDEEQFFGRTCPKCRGYFRTERIAENLYCPYCSTHAPLAYFTTGNQLEFINAVRLQYIEGFQGGALEVIDLDAIAKALPNNRPSWAYSEERQQHLSTCSGCNNRFDILGEYGFCPACGRSNALTTLLSQLDASQAEFQRIESELSDRGDRAAEWEKMTKCISEFEAMARAIQNDLTRLPLTPSRRQEIRQISYQQILSAGDYMRTYFGIDLLKGLTEDEKAFLNKMFNRRHILTHNAGRVDEKYLNRTGDSSVRLHQKITVRSREIARLIPLLRRVAQNLFAGYESIT